MTEVWVTEGQTARPRPDGPCATQRGSVNLGPHGVRLGVTRAGSALAAAAVPGRRTGAPVHGSVYAAPRSSRPPNCETDFVARNPLFGHLHTSDIAHTTAFVTSDGADRTLEPTYIKPASRARLLAAPLLSASGSAEGGTAQQNVVEAIRGAMTKLGERIVLKRAAAVALPRYRLLGTPDFTEGLERVERGAGLERWAREKELMLDSDGTEEGWLEVLEFVKWTVEENGDGSLEGF
ncbi:hypothetical protein BC834DRAFT_965627 [Gloeopeniophorella convolvens]|nr:hypothetical protein BC834DRAFT_965627 [Gloeopeniophorella convolvens]